MLIKKPQKRAKSVDEPLLYDDHRRPKTRREFIAHGLAAGTATVCSSSVLSLFANPVQAANFISDPIADLKSTCGVSVQGAGKIPFICFDLAGGANIAGSNVLLGGPQGQEDFLSTQGYSRLGLPADMLPTDPMFINRDFGLSFHSDSGFLRGMDQSCSMGARAFIDGTIIAARSENDTGNNPHNPMYGIHQAGADGSLLSLIGSQSSESGGNSMAPMNLINPEARPTKIDRASDATGLVDVGDLTAILDQSDAVAVMEAMQRISARKVASSSTNLEITRDDVIKELVNCGYVKSADIADRFGNPAILDPEQDTNIVGTTGIFTDAEYNANSRLGREIRKTAAVMKLVMNGYAGAGTVTLGGYDYHTGERGTGEERDELAGVCMGMCLEYAHRIGRPVMVYVFSDGSVASNGRIDDSVEGRGKPEWTGDNQQTASSFFLVYNPGTPPVSMRRQIGFMRRDGSVETSSSPAANNVNQLVQTVLLNYMALHGEQGDFATRFSGIQSLGSGSALDNLIGVEPIVNGVIT